MRLRWRTLLIVGAVLVCLLAVLLLVSNAIISSSVVGMEQKHTAQEMNRLVGILALELSGLDSTTVDYARWDDTYGFVQTGNASYIGSNLVDSTFTNLRVNIILFFNSSGDLVYGKAFDLVNETEIPVPSSLLEHLASNSFLLTHEDLTSNKTGVLSIPKYPMLVASRPILTSLGEGPIAGTLIMGRLLDSREMNHIEQLAHLPITIQILGEQWVSSDFETAYSSLAKENTISVQPLDSKSIAGFVLLKDVYGNPTFILRLVMPRDYYAQGQASVIYVAFALAIVGLIFTGVTIILLEKCVLSRVFRLRDDVRKIGKTRDFSARVSVCGKDELCDLANDINSTLSELEQTTRRFETLLETAKEGIITVDVDENITFVNKAFIDIVGYEADELLGLNVRKLLDEEGVKKITMETQVRREGKTSRYELVFYRKNGEPRITHLSASPLWNEDGSYAGALGIVMDITEKKHLEQALLESELKFKKLFESNPEASALVDSESRILEINPKFSELFGYSVEEAKGKALDDLIVPEDKREEAKTLTQESMKGYVYHETTRKARDGLLIPVLISAAPIKIGDKFAGCVVSYRDITDRKKVEEQLRESEEKFRGIAERSFDAIATVDLDGKITYASPSVGNILGYPQKEVIGKSFLDYFSPVQLSNATELFTNLLQGKNIEALQLELPRRDGTIAYIEVNAAPILKDGNVVGIQAVMRNITERKKMEESLRDSEERFRAISTSARDIIILMNSKGTIIYWNPAAEKAFGYTSEEVVGKSAMDIIVPQEFRQVVDQELEKFIKTGEGFMIGTTQELMVKRKDGTTFPMEFSISSFMMKGEWHALGIARDITERKRMEQKILESEERLKQLIEFAPDAIYILDLNGTFLDGNRQAEKLVGYKKEELIGKNMLQTGLLSEKSLPKALELLEKNMRGEKTGPDEIELIRKDGTIVFTEISTMPMKRGETVEVVGISRDITERKQMLQKLEEYSQQLETLVEQKTKQLKEAQEQLIKAERLAAIGQVAAMVGHDLRNPLTGIAGATYYLKHKLGAIMDKKSKEMVALIEKDIQYANKIITDLMEYSREIKLELTETTPKSIIKEALSVIAIPQKIQIIDLTRDEPKIKIDIEKAKRVFSNLIKNAIEAMPEGGKLTLQSREANGNIEFMFIDTGVGMAKEVIEKIWTPFFTTKAKGMGLGLPICKRIIEAHGGKIFVESIVGEGTTFTITFPKEPKPKQEEGGERIWVEMPESLLSTTTKASEPS